jgi:hypothetical protein
LIAGENTAAAAYRHLDSINDLAATAYRGDWPSDDHSMYKTNPKLREAMRAEILWLVDQ